MCLWFLNRNSAQLQAKSLEDEIMLRCPQGLTVDDVGKVGNASDIVGRQYY